MEVSTVQIESLDVLKQRQDCFTVGSIWSAEIHMVIGNSSII